MLKAIKKRLKDQRGLTLIELLAVVVILGIISAIAIPSIGGLIKNTKDDAKVAEGIQIVNAAKLYVSSKTPASGTVLTNAELGEYLDSIDDPSYKVTVTETSGKYSYSLTVHESVALVDGIDKSTKDTAASEKELLDY